jgi:hypothetical protein
MQNDVDGLNAGDSVLRKFALVLKGAVDVVPCGDGELDGFGIKVGSKSRVGLIHQRLIGIVVLLKLGLLHRLQRPYGEIRRQCRWQGRELGVEDR